MPEPQLNGRSASPDALLTLALTNYGHFTSMRLHMDRLVRDCREVFGADLNPDQVRGYVRRAAGDLPGAFVTRVTVSDPAVDMGKPSGAGAPPWNIG